MKLILILTILSLSAFAKEATNSFENVKVLKVYDGDTLTVELPDTHPLFKKMSIRVFGLDTPELRTKDSCEKKMGYKAKEVALTLLNKARKIDLVNCKKGKYFRLVCEVKADGVSLADTLLKKNLAYKYFGKTKEKVDWCKRIPASN